MLSRRPARAKAGPPGLERSQAHAPSRAARLFTSMSARRARAAWLLAEPSARETTDRLSGREAERARSRGRLSSHEAERARRQGRSSFHEHERSARRVRWAWIRSRWPGAACPWPHRGRQRRMDPRRHGQSRPGACSSPRGHARVRAGKHREPCDTRDHGRSKYFLAKRAGHCARSEFVSAQRAWLGAGSLHRLARPLALSGNGSRCRRRRPRCCRRAHRPEQCDDARLLRDLGRDR
jgi:hypothetical protein